jgi:hypothetical protein
MNMKRKMIPVETILGRGKGEDKRRMVGVIHSSMVYLLYLRTFVYDIIYSHPAQQYKIKINKFKF